MGAKNSDARSRRAWGLARKQYGVVTRGQLLALGFTSKAIRRRLESGRLHRVAQGVYVVGWPQLTREQRWMVAVRACGEGAALSHRSAAALWVIGSERPGVIDVSVRRRCEIRRSGLHARSRLSLDGAEITEREGIPVTTPVRTLIDLATELGPEALERAVNEADKRGHVDPESLRAALRSHPGEPGVRALRALLDRHSFRLSDSELEVHFGRLVAAAGLPLPLSKQIVNGFEVDFHWPDIGLVVETDGLRYHRTAAAQARDRLRDQVHTAAGLTPLRFTHHQVRYEPARVRQVLLATSARLAGARA